MRPFNASRNLGRCKRKLASLAGHIGLLTCGTQGGHPERTRDLVVLLIMARKRRDFSCYAFTKTSRGTCEKTSGAPSSVTRKVSLSSNPQSSIQSPMIM